MSPVRAEVAPPSQPAGVAKNEEAVVSLAILMIIAKILEERDR